VLVVAQGKYKQQKRAPGRPPHNSNHEMNTVQQKNMPLAFPLVFSDPAD
jgi:hypothetical protein